MNFIYWLKDRSVSDYVITLAIIAGICLLFITPWSETSKLNNELEDAKTSYTETKNTINESTSSSTSSTLEDSISNDVSTSTTTTTNPIPYTEAFDSFKKLETEYLTAYIKEEQSVKGTLSNIDKNENLNKYLNQFGINGIPEITETAVPNLFFEPYTFKNPKLTFYDLTPLGNHKYTSIVKMTDDDKLVYYYTYDYDSATNQISNVKAYTTQAQVIQDDAPTSPIT